MKSKSVINSYKSRNKLQKILSVLFICILAITAFNITGAWFTDSAESSTPETVLTFGSIKVVMRDSVDSVQYNNVNAYIIRDADSNGTYEKLTDSKKIIPGDELVVEMWVENVGTASCYYLANVSSESAILSPTFSGDYYFDSVSTGKTRLDARLAVKSSGGVGALGIADNNKKQEIRISTIINDGITSFTENDITISCSVSAIQSANISTSLAYTCLRTMNNDNFILNYTQLEYIECTGTQWIELDYYPNYNTIIEAEFEHTENIVDTPFFGCRNADSSHSYTLWTHPTEYSWTHPNEYSTATNSILIFNDLRRYFTTYSMGTRIQIYYSNSTFKYNTQSVNVSTENSTSTVKLPLFALRNGASIDNRKFVGKTYYFKLYDGETLVRDLVPCIRNSDSEVGLYDLVNNVFYENQSTGDDFVAGNELKNDLDYVLNYTAVEYIESTGTQVIDTGVKGNLNPTVLTDIQFNTEATTSRQLMGYGGGSAQYWGVNEGKKFEANTHTIELSKANPAERNVVEFGIVDGENQTYIEINGNRLTSGGNLNLGTLTYKLFNGLGSSYPVYAKVYGCKIYVGDELVRNLMPCIRNEDGVIGLYDLVNKVFYTNSGTGEFLTGTTT